MFWNDLHILHVSQFAVDNQRVAESCIVERFGIYHTDTVKFFLGGINIYTIGHILDVGDEI